jgi:hypothetical protein
MERPMTTADDRVDAVALLTKRGVLARSFLLLADTLTHRIPVGGRVASNAVPAESTVSATCRPIRMRSDETHGVADG